MLAMVWAGWLRVLSEMIERIPLSLKMLQGSTSLIRPCGLY